MLAVVPSLNGEDSEVLVGNASYVKTRNEKEYQSPMSSNTYP